MHVHILGFLAGLGGQSTYLGPLFRRRRRRLLCDLQCCQARCIVGSAETLIRVIRLAFQRH
jgi:hypothetical protein